MRHNFEIGGGGLIPVTGYIADNYSAGPAGRAGYEFRLFKPIGAEIGITEGGPRGLECSRFGCIDPRLELRLLDYGLRGHIGVGRLDLSAGIGGGYSWHEYDDQFRNVAMFQYSGKAAFAIDRGHHFQLAFTVRSWRDAGRPTQVWVSTMGSMVFAFGSF